MCFNLYETITNPRIISYSFNGKHQSMDLFYGNFIQYISELLKFKSAWITIKFISESLRYVPVSAKLS